LKTPLEERAMNLLGSGIPQEAVASALGVTASYISQLLSNEEFSTAVTQLKFEALSKHTARDASYDSVEDSLIDKLKKSLPLLIRPNDILGAIKVINGAKRRGQDSQDSIVNSQEIVSIMMPTQIIQQFTTNIHNQVIKTGDQDLLTMQSSDLLKQAEDALEVENQKVLETTSKTTQQAPSLDIESDTVVDSYNNEVLASL